MELKGLDRAVKYSRAYKRKKLRLRIISAFSALVVFVTTYALILPAITREREVYCGYEAHSHNSTCLSEGCNLREHAHSSDCYIAPDTDNESPEQWEATLPKDLTGNWAKDVIALAKSQLGYKESGNNISTVDESTFDQAIISGYTRYGDWYGDCYMEWSSVFVNFCLHYAGVDKEYFPYSADCAQWVEQLSQSDLLSNTPAVGDILFFRKGDGVSQSTAAIVTDLIYDNQRLVRVGAICGDINNAVDYIELSVTDGAIFGYGDLNSAYIEYYKTAPKTKTYSDKGVTVTASYLASAGIPDGAELSVTDINREDMPEVFDSHLNQAHQKLELINGQVKDTEITGFRLYDICFIYEGEEIQPKDKVDISISYPVTTYSQTASVSAVHYGDNGAELPETTHSFDNAGNLVADFETESFSLFAIVTSESFVKSVVSLTKYSITSISSSRLSDTYAIVCGNYALSVNEGDLGVKTVEYRDSVLTADETLVCWKFKASGSGYNIYTTLDGVDHYLSLNNGVFTLGTSGTAFTLTASSGSFTAKSGSSYLNISSNGVSAGGSAVLSLYTIPTGQFTVTFDGQIGRAQYMSESTYKYGDAEVVTLTTDANGYIKLPTPEETTVPGNYPLRLNGWYDIINSVYYDSSMFGATIRVTCNTTFYPEWIAETYDIGKNKDVVPNQPDTSDFIETRVFDYNELFNVHSSYYNQSDDKWYLDTNSELGFIFFDYICHKDWNNEWGKAPGNIGSMSNRDNAVNGITVNQEKTNGTRGSSINFPGTITPGIANDARIEALFGTTPVAGKIQLGEGDWLYQYDSNTGFYYYNSAANAASYNQSEQRFYVYNHTAKIRTPNDTSINDFLPFNYGDPDDYSDGKVQFYEKDNEANYWFGMSSSIKFYLPNDSGSGNNQSAHGDDMQFRFSGDDDVWVFVDGELVLDLGGVHDMVYGEINFSEGKVRTGQAITSSDIAQNSASTHTEMPGLTGSKGITETDLPVLKGGEEHTLTVYYLERGSSLSNCAVYFNLSPLYQLAVTKKDANGKDLLSGATFQAFSDKECTTPAELYIYDENGSLKALPDAKFTTDENGIATCWGLFAGTTYYIKEIESPKGYSDISEYVIEFTLSKDAQSVFVMIDSNGTQWEFAGEYVYDGEEQHLIELNVYNHKYIGGDKELFVEKIWAEGTTDPPDSITLWLYANGENANRSIVLSAENNWRGFFYELPETDSEGKEIVYTVAEEQVNGFGPTYEKIDGDRTFVEVEPAYYSSATSLTSGSYHRFVYNDQALAIVNNALVMTELDDADPNQRWLVTRSGTGYTFYNEGAGQYLYLSRSSVSLNTRSRVLTFSNNRIGYSSRYLNYSNGSFGMNSSGIQFSIQRWIPEARTETTVPVNGWTVINTPWPESMDITVEKHWHYTVKESQRADISASLYLVTVGDENSPVLVDTIILNSANGWKGVFQGLSYPDSGSYYAIAENNSGYTVSYSGETVEITVDGNPVTAHKVAMGEGGIPIQADITNAMLILLPETGGVGIMPYILGGILPMLLAVAMYIVLNKKIRI